MADFRTSIDYALNYGQNDPFFEMLRRRLRDQVAGQMQGQQRSMLSNLDARGIGQSTAVASGLGAVAAGGQQALAGGMAGIGAEQGAERFQLLRDALKAKRDERTVWDAILGLAEKGGQAAAKAATGGIAPLGEGIPIEGQGAGDIWSASAEPGMGALPESDQFSQILRRRRRGWDRSQGQFALPTWSQG